MASATKDQKNGKAQRKKTKVAQVREPNLNRLYSGQMPPITPGDFEFHLELLRARQPVFALTQADTLQWDDQTSGLTGSFSSFRPEFSDPRSLPVVRGDLIRAKVKWATKTYELWTMRAAAPQYQKDTGQLSIDLTDDMALLNQTSRDWLFRKTKHHKAGYTCDEVAQVVCARLGIKPGVIYKGKHRFALVMRKSTGLAVLRQAYAHEKLANGGQFVIRLRNGLLDVTPIRRNPILYVLSSQIQTALITEKAGRRPPATVLTGHGHVGSGKHTIKVSYTAYDRAVVRALGYVHREIDYGKVDSHGQLRQFTKRDLAKGLKLNDTIEITHQGIPFIELGDGVQIPLPEEGYAGQDSFVWVTRGSHTVQAGVYTSDFTMNATDPFLKLGATAKT